jgi:hypothetical protein
MQDYVTPTGLAMLALVALANLLSLTAFLVTPASDKSGWMLVKPGGMHWAGLLMGAGLFGLIAWVWIFVGSARSDAAFQMKIAFWLSFVFGICAAYMAHQMRKIRKTALRMRGEQIAFRDETGKERSQKVRDFEAFRRRWRGDYQLLFKDGTILTLDPYATNSDTFMGRLFDEPLSDTD